MLNADTMVETIINDKNLTACKTAVAAMARMSALFNQRLNASTLTGGLATGTLTQGTTATPTTIPGSSFITKLTGVTISLTPAQKGVWLTMNTQFHAGVGAGVINSNFGAVVGSMSAAAAAGFAAQIVFPAPSSTNIRALAIRNHLVMPVFAWLDAMIPTLAMPVQGPMGAGVFVGTYTGMMFSA